MSIYLKDPGEKLNYTENWADYLGAQTISSSSWSVPTGITQDSVSNTSSAATIWLTGGTHGQEYVITNQITTSGGQIAERSIKILCRNR